MRKTGRVACELENGACLCILLYGDEPQGDVVVTPREGRPMLPNLQSPPRFQCDLRRVKDPRRETLSG